MKRSQRYSAGKHRTIKWACYPILLLCFCVFTAFETYIPGQQLIGVWESEEKNLQIEMFKDDDGLLAGRMIYFKCTSEEVMRSSKDIENPNKNLTTRNLLGLKLVTKLFYQGNNTWDDGKIYDPNSGNTFEARIQLIDHNKAIVRGYWKYRWLGKSMAFHRKVNAPGLAGTVF